MHNNDINIYINLLEGLVFRVIQPGGDHLSSPRATEERTYMRKS